jgi:threonine/homoserine/homoserine lactone efflux protein
MAAPDILLTFLVTAALFAFLPGPAMLYAAARTVAGGRRAGLRAAMGIHAGGYAHVIVAACGLAVLFHAVPPLYAAMKIAGAVWLVWLGIGMILARDAAPDAPAASTAFRQSMLVEVLNPKTALFYLAFLPQFADPAAALPVWAQMVILGTVVNLMFSAADLMAVAFAAALTARLRQGSAVGRWLNRAGGALLVALGLRLAADRA